MNPHSHHYSLHVALPEAEVLVARCGVQSAVVSTVLCYLFIWELECVNPGLDFRNSLNFVVVVILRSRLDEKISYAANRLY